MAYIKNNVKLFKQCFTFQQNTDKDTDIEILKSQDLLHD